MKNRLLAIALAACMLVSLLAAPVFAITFSTAPVAQLEAVSFAENAGSKYLTENTSVTSVKPGETFAVKISIRNTASEELCLAGYKFSLSYDSKAFELYSYSFETEDESGQVGPFARPSQKNGGLSSKWTAVNNTENGAAIFTGTCEDAAARPKIASGGQQTIGYLLLKVSDSAENGSCTVSFTGENYFTHIADGETKDAPVENADFSSKATISITGGKAPTLGSIVVKLGNGTGVYGTASTFQLTALSTKGKDITSLVDFTVKDASGAPAAFTINNGKLSIGSNGVGTYTVTATPKADACQGEAKTATFEITPATITNPTVTITGFGKGASTDNVQYSFNPNVLTVSGTPAWYLGSPVGGTSHSGTFAAETDYSVSLNFTVNSNYVLAPVDGKLSASVAILGETKTVPVTPMYDSDNQLTGYNIVVSAKTEDKTALVCTTTPTVTTVYDTFLKDITEIPGGKVYAVDDANREHEIPGTFTWLESYPDDQKVGEPTDRGGNPYADFYAKFTPTDSDTYAVIERVHVNVLVKTATIDISDINSNSLVEKEFTYNKQDHTVALSVPDSLKKLIDKNAVAIEYTGDATKKDVGDYKVTATIKILDTAHYMFFQQAETGVRELPWSIKQATLTPADKTIGVRYGLSSKALDLEDLGLTDLANEPDVVVTAAVGSGNVIDTAAVNRDAADNFTGITLNLKNTSADDVGKKTDTVTLAITSKNYNVTKNLTVTVSVIAKDAKDLTVTGPASFPYGTTEDAIKSALTITGLPTGATPEYRFSSTGSISTAVPGSYTLTVSYEDDNNVYTGTYTFAITKLDLANATIEADGTLTYTGSEQTQNVTVKYGENVITAENYTVTNNKRTDAGTQTLTVTANAGSTLYTGSKTYEFTIAKATPTADDFTFTAPANLAYDGSPKAASVTTTNAEIGAVTVSYNPADPTNAGTYTVKIRTAETTNYKAATNLTADEWKFTIAKATITENMVGSIGDLTYTGEALTPALSVTGLTAGTDYEVTYANNTNAGTATATVTGKGNYEGTIVRNFTIKPASMNFVKEVYVSRHTNVRSEQTITLQSITGVKGEALTPSVTLEAPSSADNIFTVAPAYDAATGSVTFTLNGTAGSVTYKVKLTSTNSNYADGEYNLVFTASHRTVIAITFEDGSATYTSKPIRYETASAGESGTWTYTYVPVDGSGASLDALTSLPLTVGTYNVTAHFENADHIGDKTVTFVITKATPATPPEIKVDNTDTTLGELGNKMLVGIGVPGTINWYGPDGKLITKPHNTKIEANTEYSWTFVPDDSTNYNGISGKTTPYVRDDLSWLPGVLGGGSSFSFHDVTRFDYYYDSVKWAADNGIASGTSRFAFSPDAVCTRAQTVTFLWRAAGSPLPRYRVSPFTDVHSYDYYYEAVLWAVEQGITTGLTATTFGPDETVTRGQVATFLYRAASAAKPNTFNPFTDVKPTAYNYGAILWAYDNRITTGTSTTTFSPDAFCTRAQIVTFLYRYYQGR